jgi:Tfp pilus assembly protein PilF
MHIEKFISDFHNDNFYLLGQNRLPEYIYSAENMAVQSLNALGLAYSNDIKFHQKALDCFHMAIKIDPGNWQLWSNIVHIYCTSGDMEKAAIASNEAVKFAKGEFFDAFYNAGVVYTYSNRLPQAEEMYKKALQLNPEHPTSNFNLSLVLLRQGKYKEGFALYDWRFKAAEVTKKFKQRFIEQDEWDGRKFKKKSLLIYSEQGMGDFIQFSRYLKKVKSLGGKVICEVQEPLAQLVRDNFDVDEVVGRPNTNDWPKLKPTDYCISICSLPHILKVESEKDIISEPYITAKKKLKLPSVGKKLKVGICWCGNSDHKRDHTRSTFAHSFKALTESPKVQCYSLVKGINFRRQWPNGVVDLSTGMKDMNLIDLSDKITNFESLASAIDAMDLIVTIDTGLAHLAGAMGKPTWTLIGTETDFRWMDIIDTTPWYQSMRLFRHKTNWEDLIKEVVDALP